MMPRSNPFGDLEAFFERMSRQFDEMNRQFDTRGFESGAGSLRVDVAEHDGEIVVTADLPGFEKDDIDVSLSGRRMTVRAAHDVEHETDEEAYIRRERRHESVRRSFDLPVDVDESDATATYRNGVLTVRLPLATVDDDARRIDIE